MTTGLNTGLSGPDRTERALGWLSLAMLAAIVAALARGHAEWGRLPWAVWVHLATMGVALGLTPVILWQRRGNRRHRTLGYVWVAAMAVTALVSLGIRLSNNGGFSVIHLLSIWVAIQLPIIVWSARRHDHRKHRG